MPGVYTTTRGQQIDMARLKLKNETVVAVGNAGTNARGDVVEGGKIVKTREQLMQEHYNIRGNNIAKSPSKKSEVVADTRLELESPYQDILAMENLDSTIVEQDSLPNEPSGGLADAVSKSQSIAERIALRKRI